MRFTPLTKEQLAAQRGVLKPGPAEFMVTEAKEDTSKSSGNPMIKLTVKVWDDDGREGTVFDYLLESVQWKLAAFFESIGRPELYESGELDPVVLVGLTGRCKLQTQKDSTGKYADQTKIVDYLKPDSKKPKSNLLEDEDDPFK
jgi:hypothetical protein